MNRHIALAVVMLTISTSSMANIDCNVGTDLEASMKGIIGKANVVETAYDAATGLGLLPNTLVADAAKRILKDANATTSAISKLRSYCNLAAAKDPIVQYFQALDLLFGSTPLSPIISQDIKMATIIVDRANAVAAGTVDGAIGLEGLGLGVSISLTNYQTILWGSIPWRQSIDGAKLKSGNYILKARFLSKVKGDANSAVVSRDVSVTMESNSPVYLDLGIAGILSDLSIDPASNDVFLEITWKTGQVSIVPMASAFYKTANLRMIFPFTIKNGVFMTDK